MGGNKKKYWAGAGRGGHGKLQPLMRGVLITSSHGNLKMVGRQACDAFAELAEAAADEILRSETELTVATTAQGAAAPIKELGGESDTGDAVVLTSAQTSAAEPDPDCSIEAELNAELNALAAEVGGAGGGTGQRKHREQPRFRWVDTGCRGVVFIVCRREVRVEALVTRLFQDAAAEAEVRCRLAARVVPVTHSCKANLKEIGRVAQQLLKPDFVDETAEAATYAVEVRARNNSSVNKTDVLATIRGPIIASAKGHSYDPDDPELVVLVEIMKSVCCMSVVRSWSQFARYNLAAVGKLVSTDKDQEITNESNDNSRKRTASDTEISEPSPASVESHFPSEYERELAAIRARSLEAQRTKSRKVHK